MKHASKTHILWIQRIIESTNYLGMGDDPDAFRRNVLVEAEKSRDRNAQIEILFHELLYVFDDRVKNKTVFTQVDESFARLLMEVEQKIDREDKNCVLADYFFSLYQRAKTAELEVFGLACLNMYLLTTQEVTAYKSLKYLSSKNKSFQDSQMSHAGDDAMFLYHSLARSFVEGVYFKHPNREKVLARNSFVVSYLFSLACHDKNEQNMSDSYFDFICEAFEKSSTLCTDFNYVCDSFCQYVSLSTDQGHVEKLLSYLDKKIIKAQVRPLQPQQVLSLIKLDVGWLSQQGDDSLNSYLRQYAQDFSDGVEYVVAHAVDEMMSLAPLCSWRSNALHTQNRKNIEVISVRLSEVLKNTKADKNVLKHIIHTFEKGVSDVGDESGDLKALVSGLYDALGVVSPATRSAPFKKPQP